MAMGIRQGIEAVFLERGAVGDSPKISGYDVAKAATHCTAGKKTRPMLVLYMHLSVCGNLGKKARVHIRSVKAKGSSDLICRK